MLTVFLCDCSVFYDIFCSICGICAGEEDIMKKKHTENRPGTPSAYDVFSKKKLHKKITLHSVLSVIVIVLTVRFAFAGRYENMFTGILTLILFSVPLLIDRRFGIDIPPVLEGVVLCFIFAAEILGEIGSFYTLVRGWDTMLHTINGFLMAAVGFALVDIFNRSERFSVRLSPLFLAIVAFCFSMTIGVLWEFFEFAMDSFFATDMQKDYIITQINSVTFDPMKLNRVGHVSIDSLVVNGEDWIALYGGYIDIGLIDTMKDLIVNCIGAVVFSVIGFFYGRQRGRGRFARLFIPTVKAENPPEDKTGQ